MRIRYWSSDVCSSDLTIASAWREDERRITFITKGLGDHTRRLPEKLHVGQEIRIEGPYGCFTFDDDSARQIWIGGGIGITPFIARMKYLAQSPEGARAEIDLFQDRKSTRLNSSH